MIEARVARYNAAVRNDELPPATKRAALQSVGAELRDLELLYNFLALVAPPLSPHANMDAQQLRRRFMDRPKLFAALRSMLAVNSAPPIVSL
jgi:hypothetical protein